MRLMLLLAVLGNLARPLPTGAEITIDYTRYYISGTNTISNSNPFSATNYDLVKQAINRLVADPRLANHPIRRYFYDPNMLAKVMLDAPKSQDGASSNQNYIHVNSNENLYYYLIELAHEFVHVDMSEKYSMSFDFSFLTAEQVAFQNLMEEAFPSILNLWVRFTAPESPSDRQIRDHNWQITQNDIADAMRNDYIAAYPNYSADQINTMVLGEMFNDFMTRGNTYSIKVIPHNLKVNSWNNTFLIPEYAAYRERGEALLRHMWDHLASMMPFQLPAHMTYDYFRNQFISNAEYWATVAQEPDKSDSILYWINYDAEGNARAKLAAEPEAERRYDYLPREDEARLNRVFQEIDPHFIPVDTTRTSYQRALQDIMDKQNTGR